MVAFPKPQKKAKRRDKVRKKTGWCRCCGRYMGDTQTHHVFGGAYRRISEQADLVIEVCNECHDRLTNHPDTNLIIQQRTQKKWEQQHSHDEWMQLMGKSWL